MKLFKNYSVRFMLIVIPILVITLYSISYLATNALIDGQVKASIITGEKNLDIGKIIIEESYNNLVSDIDFLEKVIEIDLIREGSEEEDLTCFSELENRIYLEERFKRFVESNSQTVQTRLLDSAGNEIVRVDRIDSEVVVIPESELQNKADRYYFIDTMAKEAEELYTSEIDLNIENNEIQVPYMPVIRVAKQINKPNGEPVGIVIINEFVNLIFSRIRELGSTGAQDIEIINSEGYWLKSSQVDREWSFMFEDKKNVTIQILEPEIWSEISKNIEGKKIINEELIIYDHYQIGEDDYVLIYRNTLEKIKEGSELQRIAINVLAVFIGIIIIIALIIMLKGREDRRKYNRELQKIAMYDALTNIPNRLQFNRIMEELVNKGNERFAVLFMDLDGFKQINDSYGHDIGDKLLISVSNRIKRRLRNNDFVFRIGGDEFTVIATKLKNPEDAEYIAEKIVNSVSEHYQFESIRCSIGISVGIAVYPEDGMDVNQLVTLADDLMYDIKANGKNGYKSKHSYKSNNKKDPKA